MVVRSWPNAKRLHSLEEAIAVTGVVWICLCTGKLFPQIEFASHKAQVVSRHGNGNK